MSPLSSSSVASRTLCEISVTVEVPRLYFLSEHVVE